MTHKQALRRALQRAVRNGWQKDDPYGIKWVGRITYYPKSKGIDIHNHSGVRGSIPSVNVTYVEKLLFNHDFAKALWGDKLFCSDCCAFIDGEDEGPAKHNVRPYYEHLLQGMVIADDPIAYLGDHLEAA